jgi:hypothetical protein
MNIVIVDKISMKRPLERLVKSLSARGYMVNVFKTSQNDDRSIIDHFVKWGELFLFTNKTFREQFCYKPEYLNLPYHIINLNHDISDIYAQILGVAIK